MKFAIAVRLREAVVGVSLMVVGAMSSCSKPDSVHGAPVTKPPTAPVESAKLLAGPVLLTVVNAEIEPKRPTGETWHSPSAKKGDDALLGLAAKWALTAEGVPGPLATILGSAFTQGTSPDPTRDRTGPAPYVRISWANERVVTPTQWNTVLPSWEYRLVIDPPSEGPMTLTVIDLDGNAGQAVDDPIGTLLVDPEKFRRKGILTLGPFGAVKSITLVVAPFSEADFRSEKKGIRVDGRTPWTGSGVTVIAGQSITISATGQVTPTVGQVSCGPEGFALPRWRGYSWQPDSPHCGLLARIGESLKLTYVGAGGTFRAAGSGELYFGPNDKDLGNNKGEFDVDVSVK